VGVAGAEVVQGIPVGFIIGGDLATVINIIMNARENL